MGPETQHAGEAQNPYAAPQARPPTREPPPVTAAPSVSPGPQAWRLVRRGLDLQVGALVVCDLVWFLVGTAWNVPVVWVVGMVVVLGCNVLNAVGMLLALWGPWRPQEVGYVRLAFGLAVPVVGLQLVGLVMALADSSLYQSESTPPGWALLACTILNLLKTVAVGCMVAAWGRMCGKGGVAQGLLWLGGAPSVPYLLAQATASIVGVPSLIRDPVSFAAWLGFCGTLFFQPGVEWIFCLGLLSQVSFEQAPNPGNPVAEPIIALAVGAGAVTICLHGLFVWLLCSPPTEETPVEEALAG